MTGLKFLWVVFGLIQTPKNGIIGLLRWLVIRSASLAARQIQGLQQRLDTAEIALDKLALKTGNDTKALQIKVHGLLKRHRVSEYLAVTVMQNITYKKVYNSSERSGANSSCRRIRQIEIRVPASGARNYPCSYLIRLAIVCDMMLPQQRSPLNKQCFTTVNNGNQKWDSTVSSGVNCQHY